MNDALAVSYDNEKEREKKQFNIIRVIAIYSVITAHIAGDSFLQGMIGLIGVPCFLILGGFFYRREKGDTKKFYGKKLYTIIVPWAFCSLLNYVLDIFINTKDGGINFNIIDYFKYFLGYNTFFYYMTVYLLCLIIFKFISKRKVLLYFALVLNLISLTLYTVGKKPDLLYITPYLNIFNWIGFFAIGILMRMYRTDKIIISNKIYLLVSALLSAISFVFIYSYFPKGGYFNILSFLFEISMFVIVLNLSALLAKSKASNLLNELGKQTFCIYLLHINIVQGLCRYIPSGLLFGFAGTVVATALMFALVSLGKFITKGLPFKKILWTAVGIRE